MQYNLRHIFVLLMSDAQAAKNFLKSLMATAVQQQWSCWKVKVKNVKITTAQELITVWRAALAIISHLSPGATSSQQALLQETCASIMSDAEGR